MKKGIVIGAMLAVMVMVVALGAFSFASAQTTVPNTPFGRGGMMGGRNSARGQGMLGGSMHPYMIKFAAEALNLTEDALNTELNSGKSLYQVAEAKGLSAEEIQSLLKDVHAKALAQMVADGVITQEQADWMQTRMGGMWGQGGLNGGCPMGGQGMGGYGRGGRWNTQPAQPSTGG